MEVLICPVCGAQARMITARDLFGEKAIEPERHVFACSRYKQGCNTYVYAQKGTGRPLGQMVGPEVRNLRIQAHRRIDMVIREGIMSKADVYDYLGDALGYRPGHFHLANCGHYGCTEAIRLLNRMLDANKGKTAAS